MVNPLYANPTKWSNTLKKFVGNLPTNCLSRFDHYLGLALKGFRYIFYMNYSREQIQLTEKDGKSLESFSEDFTELVGEMTEKNKK